MWNEACLDLRTGQTADLIPVGKKKIENFYPPLKWIDLLPEGWQILEQRNEVS